MGKFIIHVTIMYDGIPGVHNDYLVIDATDDVDISEIKTLSKFYFPNYESYDVYPYTSDILKYLIDGCTYNKCKIPFEEITYDYFKESALKLKIILDQKALLDKKIKEYLLIFPRSAVNLEKKYDYDDPCQYQDY